MWLPLDDPVVYVSIGMLGALIIIFIILLTVVQRRSAQEIWRSVRRPERHTDEVVNTDDCSVDSDPLVKPPKVVNDEPDIEMGEREHMIPRQSAPAKAKVAGPAKAVRFSSILDRRSSATNKGSSDDADVVDSDKYSLNSVHDSWHRRDSVGFEPAPIERRSMSDRQRAELYYKVV
ncbi:hypothetical protein LTR37_000932 [Vermiconidia calcicola]|uniref:Uncharacterized protein n=1 Tax=Vermiconidia calcicola TaxID=1690605 RepID=A0ACC3NXU7_9PEZI|nr:hypothetical protein LTR37_000932 [Vermiconidia calcicola]